MWTEPIIDRTISDMVNKTTKGHYNLEDLNRVESDTKHLSDLLNSYGYLSDLITKSDWTKWDMPREAQMVRYLANLQTLIDIYAVLPTTPALPAEMDNLTVTGANNIEKVLSDISLLITNMTAAFNFCGEFYAGEV